jgi:hypothetical protein
MLFYRDGSAPSGEAAVPVPLSLRSVVLAYANPICTLWAGFGVVFAVVMIPLIKPGKELPFGLFVGAFTLVPCLLLIVLRKASRTSAAYNEHLVEIEGLPPHLVAALHQEDIPAEAEQEGVS